MAKKRKVWGFSPARQARPAVSAEVKAEVGAKAGELVEKVLKPKNVRPPKSEILNHLADIGTKWHGSSFYFIAIYVCPPGSRPTSFESRFARMEHAGDGRFNLAYTRHTGQWVESNRGLTVDQCLEAICDEPWFIP